MALVGSAASKADTRFLLGRKDPFSFQLIRKLGAVRTFEAVGCYYYDERRLRGCYRGCGERPSVLAPATGARFLLKRAPRARHTVHFSSTTTTTMHKCRVGLFAS